MPPLALASHPGPPASGLRSHSWAGGLVNHSPFPSWVSKCPWQIHSAEWPGPHSQHCCNHMTGTDPAHAIQEASTRSFAKAFHDSFDPHNPLQRWEIRGSERSKPCIGSHSQEAAVLSSASVDHSTTNHETLNKHLSHSVIQFPHSCNEKVILEAS